MNLSTKYKNRSKHMISKHCAKNKIDNLINLLIWGIYLGWIIFDFKLSKSLFEGNEIWSIALLIISVIFVYTIKSLRFYFVIYGANISLRDFFKTYVKITPVSIILPFKLGEFFRMYCYGKMIGNFFQGIIIVFWDRFIDTIALITIIICILFLTDEAPTALFYLLIFFIVSAIVAYIAFPGIYSFWRKYILKAKTTIRKLQILKLLTKCNIVYEEIINVIKGKGAVLYILSIIAWIIEIGSLIRINSKSYDNNICILVLDYLRSVITGIRSPEMIKFIFISVIFLLLIYLCLSMRKIIYGHHHMSLRKKSERKY